MKIAVGICTYGRPSIVSRVVDSLLSQSVLPDSIIIFDSNENMETEKNISKKNSDLIHYIHKQPRMTAPRGRNFILSQCDSDIIVFLDDDAIPQKNYIDTIKKSFEDENISGVTGPTINSNENLEPLLKIIRDDKKRVKIYSWGEIRSDTRRWIPSRAQKCETMIGANMSFRTNQLKAVGGFDETYQNPAYREETDPQIRILRKGGMFLYHPDALVYHLVQKSGGIEDIESKQSSYFYLAGKNHRYFCDKYFPKWKTRLAWIFWNRTPPCLWLALLLAITRSKSYLMWHKGLWENPKK